MNPTVIWAPCFINPAIALMDSYGVKPFPCAVACEKIASALVSEDREITIQFDWLIETFPDCHRLFQALQRDAIIEYATIAVAFLFVTNITQHNITEVTMRGDKADYFGDGRKYLLEISGTEDMTHLASRYSEKVRQLRANPFGKDGYVFVCCFSNHRARFSFHTF